MASTYTRKDSPFVWIRYKDSNGDWKGINSGYRQDNIGDRKQAEKLAKQRSLEEMLAKPTKSENSAWREWVVKWMASKWENSKDASKTETTFKKYVRYFYKWLQYFDEKQITTPSGFRREHIDDYLTWRKKHRGNRNTAIHEIKFLAQVLEEAVSRGYIDKNPARRLGIKKAAPKEKFPWSEDEIAMVQATLEEHHRFDWLHVTFLMGYHQAVRLRQSAIPISCIDFKRKIITYPGDTVKGGKAYSQPISPVFYETLKEIVEHRKEIKKSTLCDIPDHYEREIPASIQWREFLDSLELKHLSHHGLRATWITQAALRGIPESLAKRFVNHASTQVHEIYQKIQADDLFPMLDAFLLNQPAKLALPDRSNAAG